MDVATFLREILLACDTVGQFNRDSRSKNPTSSSKSVLRENLVRRVYSSVAQHSHSFFVERPSNSHIKFTLSTKSMRGLSSSWSSSTLRVNCLPRRRFRNEKPDDHALAHPETSKNEQCTVAAKWRPTRVRDNTRRRVEVTKCKI